MVVATMVGCGGRDDGDRGYDYAGSRGAALYADLCQVCHGEAGEGGLGPPLVDTPRGEDELRETIARRMPANDPGRCQGECASEIARFLKDGLTSTALRCDAVPPSGRRLRLLTRREYRATVRDLLGEAAPVMTCTRATECAYRDACTAGACAPSPCDRHTFVYDPQGRTLGSVHVAGAFNGWAATRADGGWALTYSSATGLWTGTFTVPDGESAYKLVLDERDWIEDTRAPATTDDGFGGRNSLLRTTCAGGGLADPTTGFPIEPRPAGFPFDDHAASQVVTATHVDAYLAAAEALADDAADRVATLHPCDWTGDRAGCAGALVAALGRRAFRRPLTDAELDRYQALATAGGEPDEALATAIHALLVSPHFLYRSELGEPRGDGTYRLTGWELATALSYQLIGTTPDDALLAAAERGDLDDPAGLEREARRLLASPRARDQLGELALQWLGAEPVLTADKRPDLFPGLDAAARAALARETRAFAAHVVFDGSGRFDELLTADYTILDADAARFYGLPPPGDGGKVTYDGRRAGVLGHASVLASHAHSDQTSPIRRGLFVRRNLLCQELPPPPPFAGGVPDVDPAATTRERFAAHTANPVCAGCHRYIDGLGFGFERLDAVGRWRETEHGLAIDASGTITDVEHLGTGTSVAYQSLPELGRLLADSQAAPACFARQYYRFARGVRETLAERCARLAIEHRFAASGFDVRELMIASVLSPDFVVRR